MVQQIISNTSIQVIAIIRASAMLTIAIVFPFAYYHREYLLILPQANGFVLLDTQKVE